MNKIKGNIIIVLLVIGCLILLIIALLFYRSEREIAEVILTRQSYQCTENSCRVKYNILSRANVKKRALIVISIFTPENNENSFIEERQSKLISPRTYSFHYYKYSYHKYKPENIKVKLEEVNNVKHK